MDNIKNKIEKLFEGLLWKSRMVTLLPVIFGLLGAFVMFIVAILGIAKTFLLVIKDPICPNCGSKLHRHECVDFFLNNTIHKKNEV